MRNNASFLDTAKFKIELPK